MLEQALVALKDYRDKNTDLIEAYPYKKFPYDISDMLDLIFLRVYKPVHGLGPSSHYITHVGTCIEGAESRLALIKKVKSVMEQAICELAEEFKLSADEMKYLKVRCLEGLDEYCVPECLAQEGLLIILKNETVAQSTVNTVLGIELIKKALAIAATRSEDNYVPKRYALVLAELYSNSREKILDSVPYDKAVALDYIRQAREYGSETAANLLENEDPVLALRQNNGVESRGATLASARAAFGLFQESESEYSSSSDDDLSDETSKPKWV